VILASVIGLTNTPGLYSKVIPSSARTKVRGPGSAGGVVGRLIRRRGGGSSPTALPAGAVPRVSGFSSGSGFGSTCANIDKSSGVSVSVIAGLRTIGPRMTIAHAVYRHPRRCPAASADPAYSAPVGRYYPAATAATVEHPG